MVNKPYGDLVGVRPGKLVDAMLDIGFPSDEIVSRLTIERGVELKRAALLVEIAATQRHLLAPLCKRPELIGMYVSIPFCPSRCSYCSFPGHSLDQYRPRERQAYVEGLQTEILVIRDEIERHGLKRASLYVGGGTPTTLDTEQWRSLWASLDSIPSWSEFHETSFEAGRPDTLTPIVLDAIPKLCRLSINPQTMCDATLQAIGRAHTAHDVQAALRLAREHGFENINMDIIIGLPGETITEVATTVNKVMALKPESITVHMFSPKRASRYGAGERWALMDDVEARQASDLVAKELGAVMRPYYLYRQRGILGGLENVGWSLPGQECLYNILMIAETHGIIGVGAGATSIFPLPGRPWRRHANPKDARVYLQRLPDILGEKRALISEWRSQHEE